MRPSLRLFCAHNTPKRVITHNDFCFCFASGYSVSFMLQVWHSSFRSIWTGLHISRSFSIGANAARGLLQ